MYTLKMFDQTGLWTYFLQHFFFNRDYFGINSFCAFDFSCILL